MNYVIVIFDTTGKIVEAKPIAIDGHGQRTDLATYMRYVGYEPTIVATVYKGGSYQGCIGKAAAIMGPLVSYEDAQLRACAIHGAAMAVDASLHLLRLTAPPTTPGHICDGNRGHNAGDCR